MKRTLNLKFYANKKTILLLQKSYIRFGWIDNEINYALQDFITDNKLKNGVIRCETI